MGRPPRVDTAGAWHHVMNRGAGRRIVFSNNRERELFTELLGVIDRRFDVETHAYCLMGNHYHLLMRSAAGELSTAMQHLSANFTRAVNQRRGTDGPIFRARFQSVLVDRHEHVLELCRYIHRNPVDLPYRGRLDRYEWSSLGPLLGSRPVPPWLHRAEVLSWFGNDARRLAEFVFEHDDAHAGDWLRRAIPRSGWTMSSLPTCRPPARSAMKRRQPTLSTAWNERWPLSGNARPTMSDMVGPGRATSLDWRSSSSRWITQVSALHSSPASTTSHRHRYARAQLVAGVGGRPISPSRRVSAIRWRSSDATSETLRSPDRQPANLQRSNLQRV